MDLNIGTAFWFASEGKGYLRSYSGDDVKTATTSTGANARPLLRFGGEGEAAGRGAKSGNKSNTESIKEVDSRKCSNMCPGFNRLCKFVLKKKCAFEYCERCCRERCAQDSSAVCAAHKHGSFPSESDANPSLSTSTKKRDHQSQGEEYSAQCRILLAGIGADEQLAGYSRHRSVYRRLGMKGLLEELDMDTRRIWERNLGRYLLNYRYIIHIVYLTRRRDDRCVSDHGREVWFPFLDESITSLISHLRQRSELVPSINHAQLTITNI
jgi:hypothetical protein